MGSSMSSTQKAYVDELYFLVTSNGHATSKSEIQELVFTIDQCCPWVPKAGTLDLEKWMKIGSVFQNNPKVSSRVLFAWCKVHASLKGLTPNNILFNQQLENPNSNLYPLLPQLLPPALACSVVPTTPPPYEGSQIKHKPPDIRDHDESGDPDLPPPDGHDTPGFLQVGTPRNPTVPGGRVVTPIAASLTAALLDSVNAASPMISAFPIIPGTPTVPAVAAQGNNPGHPGAPAIPDKYEPISMKIIKELIEAVKNYGPHAHYTKALLENLAEQKLIPKDWQLVIHSLLAPAQALLILDEMRHLATERAEENAQSNNAAMNVITRDQLVGDGQWQTTIQQLRLSNLALEQTAKIVKKAWVKLPVPSDGHSPGFASIRQGATESYSDFVSRLLVAVERQIDNHKARAMLQKQLAYENANEDCRAALTPIYSNPGTTIQNMLRVCQNIGIIYSPLSPSQIAIIEWLHLPHTPPKKVYSFVEAVADLFSKLHL
uniref:Endogenous retrovirus group K member 8 Gag polyprotein-like n=1 Tax=Pogona vitticeps TaxID=103695 RepID=A0ABM5F7W6_9SAUR